MSVEQKKDKQARIRAKKRRYPVEIEGGFVHDGKRHQLLLMPNDTVLMRVIDIHTDEIIEEMNTKKNKLTHDELAFMFERRKGQLLGKKVPAHSVYSDNEVAIQCELFEE